MPKKTKIYSNPNAYEVVSAFLEKYARATYIFAKINRIDSHKLVHCMHNYYRYQHRKWYAIKKAVKRINEDEHYFQNAEELREFLTYVKVNYPLIVTNSSEDDDLGKLLLDVDKVFGIELISQRESR